MLAGDFNVVPTDLDIYPTRSFDDNALLQSAARGAFARLLEQGWTDAIRTLHPDDPMFTFWSDMRGRWGRNAGLRLDYLTAAGVDKNIRDMKNASDHAPAWVALRTL